MCILLMYINIYIYIHIINGNRTHCIIKSDMRGTYIYIYTSYVLFYDIYIYIYICVFSGYVETYPVTYNRCVGVLSGMFLP